MKRFMQLPRHARILYNNLVHTTLNENGKGTQAEVSPYPGSSHMGIASDKKLGGAETRTGVGLVAKLV